MEVEMYDDTIAGYTPAPAPQEDYGKSFGVHPLLIDHVRFCVKKVNWIIILFYRFVY